MSGPRAPKVLYIGGTGRSGSTLLSRLFGELPGFFAAGELRYLWREGLGEDRLCGCGLRFSVCDFWSAVGVKAFNGWDQIDPRRVAHLEASSARQRHLPLLLAPRLSPSFERTRDEFEHVLERLYGAIAEVSDARVIVDSSKDPAYALMLRATLGKDLMVAHLVRDSRAVAFSWSQQKPALDREGMASELPRFDARSVGVKWTAYNSAMELLRTIGVPYVRLRYDDLVTDPREQIARVGTALHLLDSTTDLSFLDGGQATIGVQHTLAGNPMRFGSGSLTLRHDERWKTNLNARDRLTVTALTWPLLWRYGFSARSFRLGSMQHMDR